MSKKITAKQIRKFIKKTFTGLLVGVFLFNCTFGWAQGEKLFSTDTENMSFSSGPAKHSKLAAKLRTTLSGFKERCKAAAICRFIEKNINSSLEDVRTQFQNVKSNFENIHFSFLPNEIIIEIPEEGMAVRYFNPTEANAITPYSDIRRFRTKEINPGFLSRQIIYRIKALPERESISPTESSIALARKAFSDPQQYRDIILNRIRINPLERYDGKGLVCFFLTKFCPVGCRRCFYSSPPPNGKRTRDDTFTEEGVTKLIKFIEDANIGYLLVAGGGDPFVELKSVCRITEEAKADTIVLVTSGFWAKHKKCAQKVVDKIYKAFKKRNSKARVILRLSVDNDHVEKIGMQPILNLLEIFQEKFANEEMFELQVHTMFDDPTIDELLRRLPVRTTLTTMAKPIAEMTPITDRDVAIKVTGREMKVTLENGFPFIVGFAKFFYTDWRVNLNNRDIVERNTEIFDRDMVQSQNNNPAVVFNTSGRKGLDFFINHDGNVMSWGCNTPDNSLSLYDYDARTIIEKIFADVISLSFIEKGIPYRDAILNEVNPKAVLRLKAINMRDFGGSIVNEEAKSRLYLSIRVFQDYIMEGRVSLDSLPPEIQKLVSLDKQTLIRLYHESDYSIIDQYLSRPGVSVSELLTLYDLISLGHYDVTPEEMEEAIRGTGLLTKSQREEFFTKIELRNDQRVKQFFEWTTDGDYEACKSFLQECISIYNGDSKDVERIFRERYLPYILTNAPPFHITGLRNYLINTSEMNEIALTIATDAQYELELKLNSPSPQERKTALKELSKMIEYGIIECAPKVEESNIHIHSKYSFSPYYPEAIAYWAKRAGLRHVGIMDHDTVDGIESFREAREALQQNGISGFEMRGNLAGTPVENRIFNASDVPNVIYLLCQGLPFPEHPSITGMLAGIRKAKDKRNRAMINKVNKRLEEVKAGIVLDYDNDIIPLAENGNCVDRHLMLALVHKINENYLGKAREETYARIIGKEELSKADKKAIATLKGAASLLRYGLLKPMARAGTKVSCFILPNENECPSVEYIVSEIKKANGIPIYPYPEPAEADRIKEEKTLRELFPYLKSIDFLGIEIMTNRISEEDIERLVNLADEFGLKVFTYRDVNKETVPLVQDKASVSKYPQLRESADFLAGHEFLARYTGFGYYSQKIIDVLPDDNERFRFFVSIGAFCFKELQILSKELEASPDKWAFVKKLIEEKLATGEQKSEITNAKKHTSYIDKNKTLFENTLGEGKPDVLFRVPIEVIESAGMENIRSFLAIFQDAPNGYVELFYMSGFGKVTESIYKKYGLQKKPLPEDLKDHKRRTRENTVTLFPVLKGEELDEIKIRSRLGSVDMSPKNTVLSPIGLQHDQAGLIRSTVLGLKIMNIARDIRKGIEITDEYKDEVQRIVLEDLKLICDRNDMKGLAADDIISLAISDNMTSIVRTLKKLIKLLPITPIDPEELRQIFEHAAKKFA